MESGARAVGWWYSEPCSDVEEILDGGVASVSAVIVVEAGAHEACRNRFCAAHIRTCFKVSICRSIGLLGSHDELKPTWHLKGILHDHYEGLPLG